MIIGNERFDPSNRDEPIQRLITDQHYGVFSPKKNNYYDMFIEMNTYEIESGIFSSEKTGKFYTVSKEKTFVSEQENANNKVFLNFDVRLDSKVKHYKSIAYGIIDAIGTLGGVFEILYWILMLFFGSIRENMYLFSVINTLTQISQDEDTQSRTDNNNNKDAPMVSGKLSQFAKI